MGTPAPDIVDSILHRLGTLTKATVAGYIISAVIGLAAGFFANANREAACALRGDLERRVETSKDFLIEHPNGAPQLGFTRADVLKEITNQQKTADALDVVICL